MPILRSLATKADCWSHQVKYAPLHLFWPGVAAQQSGAATLGLLFPPQRLTAPHQTLAGSKLAGDL